MNWLDLLILSLASWRLANFIVKEAGPFNLSASFRNKFPLGGLTNCLYCALFWVGALMYILWLTPLASIVTIFAISGGALMLATYTGVHRG